MRPQQVGVENMGQAVTRQILIGTRQGDCAIVENCIQRATRGLKRRVKSRADRRAVSIV